MRATLTCALLFAVTVQPAWTQQRDRHWSIDVLGVAYDAADALNGCASGYGLGLDLEGSYGSRVRLGGAIGVREAAPGPCTLVAGIRQIGGQTFYESSQIHLLGAPVLTASVGVAAAGNPVVMLNVRSGAIVGTIESARTVMPLGQAELMMRSSWLGLIARLGAFRAPVRLTHATTVLTEWPWRWLFEGGLGFYF